jgi:hypothetical protein
MRGTNSGCGTRLDYVRLDGHSVERTFAWIHNSSDMFAHPMPNVVGLNLSLAATRRTSAKWATDVVDPTFRRLRK